MNDLYTVSTLSSDEFEELSAALAPQHIPLEQSPLWGEFDDAQPDRRFLGSFRYDAVDGELVAIGSATLYQQKGRNWIWFKHGPLFASTPNTKVVQQLCATLRQQFSKLEDGKPVFVRLSSPTRTAPLKKAFEHTMYDQTVIVDLRQSEAEIRSGMSQSGRRGLKKAESTDLSVREVPNKEALENFTNVYYPIMQETALRDGFGSHPASLYASLLTVLNKNARLYVATKDKQVLAWAITTEYGGQATYYYGASSKEARDLNAPYLLHWQIMLAMKQRGNESYDFMGIAGNSFPELANVTQFKLKFSKNIVDVAPTYDLPVSTAQYLLLTAALKLKRRLS